MNLDILKILAHKGPLKLTHLMYKTNLNCNILKKNVAFLIKQGLVEKRTLAPERIVYSIAQKGLTLLKGWKEVKELIPAVENDMEEQLLFKKVSFY